MTLAYIGGYTLFLVLFWGAFIVAKIHAYKFKNFSYHIADITKIMIIFAIFLSLLGYVVILFWAWGSGNTITVDKNIIETNFDSDTNFY